MKEAKLVNSSMDLLIPPEFKKKLENKMARANIAHVVTIKDLQRAINNQNLNANIRNSKAARKASHFFYLNDFLFYLFTLNCIYILRLFLTDQM